MIFRRNIDIQIDDKIIKKNRVPILTKDKQWKTIIGNQTNRIISSLSKKLEDLLLEEKSLIKKLNGFKEHKKILMEKIIYLSDLLNTKGDQGVLIELEKCKEEIAKANDDIDSTMETLEEYPKEIERVNLALLRETVKLAYKDIINNQNNLKKIDEEISNLREKLGDLWDNKTEIEKKMELLYSFLHAIIGHEEMEKLDIHYFKNKE
ncbi:coiled-coil domain-containing protein [Natronincola ferrireducens]|uniref:Uncharacterized protein n=1 Tax=Natronincola ferrireducens TaxID=393762 RepID=A0A1G9G5J9_9FIRM|nr:hypothetical protein [Natronincola ferrireducens]SDK95929.1 hypothetical protein SAMN05660472_02359 [Natronincola ferrireducens]